MLKAGAAITDITPPVGIRMAGFAGRTMPSLAVHDPLTARALVLDDGEQRVGLVALDLLYATEDVVARVREMAEREAGIPPDGLLIASIHTHSGPEDAGEAAPSEEFAYWEALPGKVAEAVAGAAANLAPARLGAASGWCAVGINRRERVPGGRIELGRNHFGKFDTEVGVLRVEHADGRPLAAVMNYACHPVCLMADSYLISADYPGFARYLVEQGLGGGAALFFNGASGNVNPREAAVDHGLASGSGFRIAERAGAALAEEVGRVWGQAVPKEEVSLSCARRTIALPSNYDGGKEIAERALEEAERMAALPPEEPTPYVTWRYRPSVERARRTLEEVKARGREPIRGEIQAIRMGDTVLVGWPGEVFCELGMALKSASPFRATYVIGCANGAIGYVPTPEAFGEGGYEVASAAHLSDEAGLVLVEESLALVRDLYGGQG